MPGSTVLRRPVTMPASASSITPSESISVWIPRSRRSVRAARVASGILPIPICSVAPSGISEATLRPISRLTSSSGSGAPLGQRHVHRHELRDAVDVEEGVPEGARHVGVDLGEDQVGGIHGRAHDVDRHAEADEAEAVGRAHLDQGDVDVHAARSDELRDLREEDRHEVGPPLLHRLADVGADEERGVAEARLQPRLHVGGRAQGHQVHDLVARQVRAVRHHRLDEAARLRGARADENALAGRDQPHRLLGAGELGGVADSCQSCCGSRSMGVVASVMCLSVETFFLTAAARTEHPPRYGAASGQVGIFCGGYPGGREEAGRKQKCRAHASPGLLKRKDGIFRRFQETGGNLAAMPSMAHEILLDLFKNRPSLAAEILAEVLGISLPPYTEARLASTDLTEIQPAEYRADVVVVLLDGDVPRPGGHRRGPTGGRFQKALQLARLCDGLARHPRLPGGLLVVAPDPAVADWCAEPIETGVPGFVLRPPVLRRTDVPVVTDPGEAARRPELGVLSAMAHGETEQGATIAADGAARDPGTRRRQGQAVLRPRVQFLE